MTVIDLHRSTRDREGEIQLVEIVLPSRRLRRLRQEVVDELAQSMLQVGLIQAVAVSEDNRLIAGWHRIAAAKQLGWSHIRAVVVEDRSADLMRIMEIDENLVRADLSPAERAAHHAERKKLYEREFPETRQGGTPGKAGGGKKARSETGQNGHLRYTADAATKTGASERTVRREVARGAIPNVIALAGTALDTADELDALAKLPRQQQKPLIDRAKSGEKVSAKTKLKQIKRDEREKEFAASAASVSITNKWQRFTAVDALYVGKAAEHLVCADACMQKHNAFLSSQGSSYDVVIETGGKLIRVQVKSSQAERNVNVQGRSQRLAYNFNVRRRGKNGQQRLTAEDADIVACVGVDIGAIAYFPIDDCPTTIQLERSTPESNGYVRHFTGSIFDYPLERALAKSLAAEHYINLLKMFPAFPRRQYAVIYADCPWSFEPYSRESGMDRAADNHYPTLSTDLLMGIGPYVPAADNSVLFFWATVPMLPQAIKVMAAWGFAYKSHCVWSKSRQGTGYWFRNTHELLLVGTRGNIPAPAPGKQPPSVIEAPIGRHSAKPAEFDFIIEQLFPSAAKLEMFARRSPRLGWDNWGNEAAKGDG